jgi:proteasome lid subunit RPN8/RPN11
MIQIPKQVYRKFLRFALENANPYENPRAWKECIGLVLGRIPDEFSIIVTDFIPMGSGTSVFVDITDYERVFSLISPDRIDRGEVIVGWAHTHPGLGLFFSGTDIQTQITYQKMHSQSFGLVLDPSQISSHKSGFNIYRVNTETSRPYTIDYHFEEDINFKQIHNQITSELYEVPPVEILPIFTGENEITWKNIVIKLDIPTNIKIDDRVQIKLVIDFSTSQFIRLEYVLKESMGTSLPIEFLEQQPIFHETLEPGILATFSHQIQNSESWIVVFSNLKIADYNQVYIDLPDLVASIKPDEYVRSLL